MPDRRPITILCVSSYEKGQEFLRTCKAIGCRVYLLTVEKLRNADWPREAIDEMFFMPEDLPLPKLLNAVSYAARTRKIDRIVALDEFDMENVSAIREHLRGSRACAVAVEASFASFRNWHEENSPAGRIVALAGQTR